MAQGQQRGHLQHEIHPLRCSNRHLQLHRKGQAGTAKIHSHLELALNHRSELDLHRDLQLAQRLLPPRQASSQGHQRLSSGGQGSQASESHAERRRPRYPATRKGTRPIATRSRLEYRQINSPKQTAQISQPDHEIWAPLFFSGAVVSLRKQLWPRCKYTTRFPIECSCRHLAQGTACESDSSHLCRRPLQSSARPLRARPAVRLRAPRPRHPGHRDPCPA